MKKLATLSLFVGCATVLLSCGNSPKKTADPQPETTQNANSSATSMEQPFVLLENYFLKNTIQLPNEVNLVLAKDSTSFYEQVGIARTMTNKVVAPDFATKSIVGIACKPTDVATTIGVSRIVSTAAGINISVHLTKGEKQSFTITPMVLLEMSKIPAGTAITVFEGETELAKATW